MGPRSDERGKGVDDADTANPAGELQWGRVRMNAERDQLQRHVHRQPNASMGPRSDERGKATAPTAQQLADLASMGPRSDERGKVNPSASATCDSGRFNGAAFG